MKKEKFKSVPLQAIGLTNQEIIYMNTANAKNILLYMDISIYPVIILMYICAVQICHQKQCDTTCEQIQNWYI